MPPRSSNDRGRLDFDVTSLQRLTARFVKDDVKLDIKCWEKIERGLQCVLDRIPADNELLEATSACWTSVSSPAGRAALECMQAVVEHAPAAMSIIASSKKDKDGHLDLLVVPKVLCKVLEQFNLRYKDSLPAAWPIGLKSSALALVKTALLLPQRVFLQPVFTGRICDHLTSGRIDLPLKRRLDLILIHVSGVCA